MVCSFLYKKEGVTIFPQMTPLILHDKKNSGVGCTYRHFDPQVTILSKKIGLRVN